MIKALLPILLCISKLNSFAGSSIQTLTGRWIGTYGINETTIPIIFPLPLQQTAPLSLIRPTKKV
jgi:hypothetical protein